MDGFLTEGGRTNPSELAKNEYSGMLSSLSDGLVFAGRRPFGWGRWETSGAAFLVLAIVSACS